MRAAVIGAAGYAGGELLRLLLGHPDVTELVATSRSQAGRPLGEVHPHLAPVTDARFAGLEPAEAARGRDVVFLSLEHGASSRVAGEVIDAGPGLLADLAADFRLHDLALYQRYYGPHQAPALVNGFTYALADVLGEELRGKTALAAPGCFATAAHLALHPVAGSSLAVPPTLFAVTGSSGAGVQPRATTHHPARAQNLFAYSPLAHRHEAEVLERWRQWGGSGEPRLLTHSGPFVRGIHLTAHLRFTQPVDALAAYIRAYAGRPFVRVGAEPPELTQVVGSNTARIGVVNGADGLEAEVLVAIDNLVKGAGGQAVQAMNLALGLPETAGLRAAMPFPV
ncbi:MAG TPA: N-acetyl-gamma-glutamyl-phosphate reductase [Gemmatimonadales bacterium]|nr:N-acetyl-gamma-glutamyl-phosphate reductase [Gemmatimonadales bacterium]